MLLSGRYATGGFARPVEFFIFKGLKMPNYKSHEGGNRKRTAILTPSRMVMAVRIVSV